MDQAAWQKRGEGHRQRLRDKFLRHGLSVFTDEEILELLFSFGTPRQDCKERAREALRHFGGLAQVLEAPISELTRISGVGEKNAFAVRFIQDVARKYLKERIVQKTYIRAASDLVEYLWHSLSCEKRESFVVTFLDAKHAVIMTEHLFTGTLTASAVYPREVVKKALEHHAAAIVLAHNHPSGSVQPSPQDIELTRRLHLAARLFDMEVLDHIVIGDIGRYYSFADEGIMASIANRNAGILQGK